MVKKGYPTHPDMEAALRDLWKTGEQMTPCPEDKVLRLAYADWLEEHGDPVRAAFFRWLVETGTCPWLMRLGRGSKLTCAWYDGPAFGAQPLSELCKKGPNSGDIPSEMFARLEDAPQPGRHSPNNYLMEYRSWAVAEAALLWVWRQRV